MNIIHRTAEEVFRAVLERSGAAPPALVDIEAERNEYTAVVEFRARFSDGTGRHWVLHDRDVQAQQLGWRGRTSCPSLRSLYSILLEDHLLEQQLRPYRQEIDRLYQLNANPATIAHAVRGYQEFERHLRRHHQTDTNSSWDWSRGPSRDTPLPYDNSTIDNLLVQTHERYSFSFNNPRGVFGQFDGPLPSNNYGTPEAQAKAIDLLKSWLTPEQAKQYEEHKHFEVVGSKTGKRYRVKHGRQMNVEELDRDGKRVRGLCALLGGLAAGDCMLGQKIVLENDEPRFLATANVF